MLQVGDLGAVLRLDQSQFDAGLKQAEGKFSSFGSTLSGKAASMGSAIGSAMKTGLVAGTVALAGVATAGVKTFMDIESAAADAASKMDLSAMAQKSGKTIEETFKGVKEHVMALSDELGQLNTNAFDPTQIATAMANLAAGGFDVATASAKDLEPILSLATATTYDLDKSAGLAMSTMNQFGMGVGDLGRISDVYATAAGKSAAGMSDFDYAMQQAGPVAKGVGMSFEELTARVSKLADAGYSGEKSGTALRTAMMALTSPTKTQAATLEKLGISYDQIDPRVHSFGETLDLLTAKGADIYDFGEIFGKEGAAIVYSSAQQSAAVKELTGQLEDSKGAASSMAKMMLDSLKGSFDAAMGAASSLAYLIGGKLTPSLKGAFEWFSAEGAPAIREFINAVADGDWTKTGDLLAAGIKAGWAKLKDLGSQLLGWLKGVDWGGVGDYIVQGIKAAWNELMSLGGQLLSSLQSVDWGAVGTSLLDAISSAIDSVIDYAAGIYDYFVGIDWGGVWDSLVSAFNSAIESLSNIGSTIMGYFDSIDWGTVGFKIGQAIRDAIQKLSDIGSQIWQYLTTADWAGAGSSIAEKIKGGLAKLKEFWTEFKSGLSAVDFATAGKEIGDKIKTGLGKVADYAKSIYDQLIKQWKAWIDSNGAGKLGEDLAHAIVKGAADLGKWIYQAVEKWWKNNGSSLGGVISAAIDFATLAAKTAWQFVTGFANTVVKAGKGTIGAAILDIIGNAMNDAWQGAGDSLIAEANQWRKDAESIWEASAFDTAIDVALNWDSSGPLPKDGETRGVTYIVSTTGEDITQKINAIQGTTGASGSGKASGYWSGGNYWLTSQSGGVKAADWAYQMGASGATFSTTQAKLREAQTSGATMTASDMEKIMAEFTKGQDEYKKTHKTAAEEAAKTELDAAKEEAKIETDAAKDAASTTTAAAKDAAAEEKAAALTFRQQIEKAVKDTDTVWRASNQAVKIGLDETGRQWAVIGQVAQRQWEEGGKRWADGSSLATTTWSVAVATGATNWQRYIELAGTALGGKLNLAGGNLQSKLDIAGSSFKLDASQAATNLNGKVASAASDILSKSYNAGNAMANGGNSAKSSMASGGSSAGSALSTGASAIRSAASSLSSAMTYATIKKYGNYYFATGGVTSGPQMAVIGEDGSAYPEFVIPTKTKRWDLLKAAMAAYGIPGFAAGTATGAVSAGSGEPSGMTATFGITGLASMAKDVKRIINDLKDFFRISWGIVKSEASKYWKQINEVISTEITVIRDNGWQAALDIRNAWIGANAAISEDAKAFWAGYWTAIEPSVSSIKENFVQSFSDIQTSAKDAIDGLVLNSESSLQAFESKWSEIWSQLVTDMSDAQAQITEGVQVIADALEQISVDVNINANIGGGGGGGGSGGMDWNFGGDDDWLAPTGDWSDFGGNSYNINTGGGGCTIGNSTGSCSLTAGGCPSYQQAVIASTGPLATAGLGVTSRSSSVYSGGLSGGYYSGSPSGYSLPAIFAAHGALLDDGPNQVIAGEAGEELILPPKYTALMTAMADRYQSAPNMVLPTQVKNSGVVAASGGSSANIENLLEKLLEAVRGLGIDVFIDSDEVGKKVMKKLQRKGASF